MSARTSQHLRSHDTAAVNATEIAICSIEEIASMVVGIKAISELPMEGLTLAQLKKRMGSLDRLTLLTVRFADASGDHLSDVRDGLKVTQGATSPVDPGWMPAGPATMPPTEQTVIAWDGRAEQPCVVFLDPDEDCWVSQFDGGRIDEGTITHWRYYSTPSGNSGGAK